MQERVNIIHIFVPNLYFLRRMIKTIVNPDMVWKPGELQSVYNELSFYVETCL